MDEGLGVMTRIGCFRREGRMMFFFVKFLHQALEQEGDSSFSFKVIWFPWIPPKVSFFFLGGNME